MDLSIIIPSFNGGEIIDDLVSKISENLSGRYTYEIIFVFDNGNQETWQIIKRLKNKFPEIINTYHLARNYGQHRAIQFGLNRSKGNFVITMDEDLQHDPDDILILIEKQQEGNYDLVYGKFPSLQHKGIRNKISAILRRILKLFIPYLYEHYSPYRLIRKETADMISTIVSPYIFIDDLLCRITQNIALVNITHHPRIEGQSSYTIGKLLRHGILIILTYSRIVNWFLITGGGLICTGSIFFLLRYFHSMNLLIKENIYKLLFTSGLLLLVAGFLGIVIRIQNKKGNSQPVIHILA